MTIKEAMQALETAGSEKTRKILEKHGVSGKMFGVSYADLGKLARRIKIDGPLATELWRTGNHDARILASMVADPTALTPAMLDGMVKDVSNYVETAALAGVAAQSPQGRQVAEAWIKSDDEWKSAAGWYVVSQVAMRDTKLPDGYFADMLGIIEKKIGKAKNRTRHAMNGAVIGIGVRNPKLQAVAIAAARRIGKVVVDHGDTACETPEAEAYILKTAARRKAK